MGILEKLVHVAAEQYGFVATWQAKEIGIPSQRLNQLAERGKLDRISHGIYYVNAIPLSEHRELAEAVLWSKNGALTGVSVLALLGLCDVNPRKIHVASPVPVRRKIPGSYQLHFMDLDEANTDNFKNIRTTTLQVCFELAIENGTQSRLIKQGLKKAEAMGLIGEVSNVKLLAKLHDRDGGI